MKNNSVKITAMICGTVLGIFLLYQFVFSPYARCVNAGKSLPSLGYSGLKAYQVEKEFAQLKVECSVKT